MKIQSLTTVKFTGPFYIYLKRCKNVDSEESTEVSGMILDYESGTDELVGIEIMEGAEVTGLGVINDED